MSYSPLYCSGTEAINVGHLNPEGERVAMIGHCILSYGHEGRHRHVHDHVVIGVSDAVIEAIRDVAASRGYSATTSGHRFHPLKRWRNRGRCRWCMVHEAHHVNGPRSLIRDWFPARPLRDKSEAIHV